MSFNFYLILGLWLGLCVGLPLLFLTTMKNGRGKTAVMSFLLILYIAIVIIGVFGAVEITKDTVTINFDFSHGFGGKPINWAFENLILMDTIINLVMLIPLGLVISYFLRHVSVLKSILICWYLGFVFGFFFELGQYILPVARSVQLSDAIFNMISLFIGGFIGRACVGLSKKFYKQK